MHRKVTHLQVLAELERLAEDECVHSMRNEVSPQPKTST